MSGSENRHTVPEVARLLGISERGVRDKIERGQLRAEKDGKRWIVLLPAEGAVADAVVGGSAGGSPRGSGAVVDAAATAREGGAPPIEAAYRVTPADVGRAVERTAAQYMGDLRTVLAEVGRVYEGQLAAQQETIAELRRRAEAAEAQRTAAEGERDALRLQLAEATVPPVVVVAAQDATETPPATTTTLAAHRPLQGLWRRLRRRLAGE